MPPEFRSYTTVEVAKRLGVSLQTVQRWVDAGHLKAWKTPGGHRRVDADSAEELFKSQSAVAGPRQMPPGGGEEDGPRIVIVDDDPLDLELMSALVARLAPDAVAATASDGFQGLVLIGRLAPDVVITDINMPHLDGIEMIRSLCDGVAVRPATIVAVSSLSPSEMAARGKLLPGVHFLAKPVDEKRFARILRAALTAPPQSAPG